MDYDEMEKARRDKTLIAHVLVPYIRQTETFIYDRIVHSQRFVPVVISDEPVRNIEQFPFKPIHTLADCGLLLRKANHLLNRVLDYLPFYNEMVRRLNPVALHAHFGPVGVALLGLRRKSGIPLITSFYGIDASALLRDEYYIKVYPRLWEEGDMISVLSRHMKDALIDAGCPAEKIRIHHLAVNTSDVRPRPEPASALPVRVVCVCRLVEKKGVDVLLSAVAAARSHVDMTLDLAGEGPLEHTLRQLVSELGMEPYVRFHGHLKRPQALTLMSGAHIFALLSHTAEDGDMEGTPTALIEAGALAVPCVSTRHAGIPEIIEHNETGLLVNENDVYDAAAALVSLAQEPTRRAQMGAAARRKIEREFSIHSVIRQIEDDYQSLKNM
jgi:colanic acid/amylovoran biosynthesis glycosyltransferase